VTAFPGAIGYVTYQLPKPSPLPIVVIITALSALFAKRLAARLFELGEDLRGPGTAFAEFMLAWALLIVLAVAVALAAIFAIPEEALSGAVAGIAGLVARIAPLMRILAPAG
jgi:hypothetical protein